MERAFVGVNCRQFDIMREDGRKAFSASEDNLLTLVSYGHVRRGQMQGVLKHRKLGSAEEQKSGVDIILSYLSALPDF